MRKQQKQGKQGDQQSQQNDKRPQQARDLQRNKQSDRGQNAPPTPGSRSQQGADSADQERRQGQGGKQPARDQQRSEGSEPKQNVYGEGNYAASKQYNDATRQFVKSGRVDDAARADEPRSDADALQMQAAEAKGKRHAKGEDPSLNRKSSGLAPETPRAPKPGEEE